MRYKRASIYDMKFLLRFYNDPLIQEKGLNLTQEKVYEKNILDTIKYFERKNLDMFILIYKKRFIGLLMIYEKNKEENFCKIGISFVDEFRYKKLFKKALELAENIVSNYGYFKIIGEVDKSNKYVIEKILKLGFSAVKKKIVEENTYKTNKKLYIFEKNIGR